MSNHFHCLPIDKATIKSRLCIHPDFFADPKEFIRRQGLEVRSSKLTRGRCKHGPTRNLTVKLLKYKGIEAKLRKVSGDPLTEASIHLNPGVCLYNHNGSVLSLSQFLHALGLVVTHLKTLLSDPNDWVDLIPGLGTGGVAYWHYLEILLQCADADGSIFATFRHLSPDKAQIPVRHWPTSIRIGGDKSDRLLAIYLKGTEMVAKNKLPKGKLPDDWDILRFEARLKGTKLVQYLGNERNVEIIDGEQRLVRFYPSDLVAGHRACFNGLKGVFCSGVPLEAVKPKQQHVPLGRLLARVALDPRTKQTFPELLKLLSFYSGASSKWIREEGQALLSHHSSLSCEELFSDAAYLAQPGIGSEEREEKVRHDIDDAVVPSLIYKAYRPPDLPFQPMTPWPGYLRASLETESPNVDHE